MDSLPSKRALIPGLVASAVLAVASLARGAEPYDPPDRDSPGDAMIQAWLAQRAVELDSKFLEGIANARDWEAALARYREEYFYMLGLWPLPEKTPLRATVTGTIERADFTVEKLHYQSRPGLYVTANLYRPTQIPSGQRLPAVLYVCGHSYMGRNGNKTAFQSHGIWFARHGYVCLMLDTLQLGEIAGIHHGTYRENRWWWLARGYTPAGVECWNGIRGIDYLQSRPEVDPERIAVTGISGGGAATFWISAADERVKVAVPVSGMADLESYLANRVINGHCDCMFLHNAFRWPWTRIAGLIAPRPLLFVNSHRDPIFPMDANERVIARLELLYAHFGAGDRVDAVVSLGGHAYRADIRKAAYRFINMHLKGDAREVGDSEVDLVVEDREKPSYPIAPESLRVFPADSDIPSDQKNTTADLWFVAQASVPRPERGSWMDLKNGLVRELRRVTFGALPERVAAAKLISREERGSAPGDPATLWIETEPGIRVLLEEGPAAEKQGGRAFLGIEHETPGAGDAEADPARRKWIQEVAASGWWFRLEPRGVGATRWTVKSPPNFVERSHVLLGTTADAQRVLDAIAAARYVRERTGAEVWVVGRGPGAVLAACAALLEDEISGVVALEPPDSLMGGSPRLLNALRVLDVPELFGLVVPRPLCLVQGSIAPEPWARFVERVRAWYEAAGELRALSVEAFVPGASEGGRERGSQSER